MGAGGSKRLTDRKEILQVAHALLQAFAGHVDTGIDARVDQILLRSLKPEEGGRVNAITQVYAQRPHRRAVADAKAYGMHHVIEVLKVFLVDPERNVDEAGIGIAGIVKDHSPDIFTDHGKTQYSWIEYKGCASQ